MGTLLKSQAEFAGLFRDTQGAELKTLMPEDANEAMGHCVRTKRSKSGAVSFDLVEMEVSHASILTGRILSSGRTGSRSRRVARGANGLRWRRLVVEAARECSEIGDHNDSTPNGPMASSWIRRKS